MQSAASTKRIRRSSICIEVITVRLEKTLSLVTVEIAGWRRSLKLKMDGMIFGESAPVVTRFDATMVSLFHIKEVHQTLSLVQVDQCKKVSSTLPARKTELVID